MARRLFSTQIVDSDAFLDMPASAQNLYFHLGMRADDDGFVGNPKKIARVVGANDDDLKLLIAKRFILTFESGVVVIKHWLIHNTIRKDRYNPTQYLEEKKTLFIKENKSYTDISPLGLPNDNQLATNRIPKLSKVKLSKDKDVGQADSNPSGKIINSLIRKYHNIVKEQKGYEAKTTMGDIKNLKSFLKESSEEEITAIFQWYVLDPKFKEFPNLSSAISAHSVNLFRGQKNRTW